MTAVITGHRGCLFIEYSTIALMNIESQLAKDIDIDSVVDTFAKLPSLRDTDSALTTVGSRRIPLLS